MRNLGAIFNGPFTGWHMLGVMCLFFGTVISVNITMAYLAGSSWSGLIVKNTYVASQNFDKEVTETERMKARGWVSRLDVTGKAVTYSLTNALGSLVAADVVSVAFSRPVGEDQDRVVTLQRQADGRFETAHDLASGQWLVKVTAFKDDERIYTDVMRIIVAGVGSD